MEDEDILVEVEQMDPETGDRKKKEKLGILRRRQKKGNLIVQMEGPGKGKALSEGGLTAGAKEAAARGETLKVKEVPPVSGG